MSKFSNEEINNHLRRAASQMAPNQVDSLWEQPVCLAKGNEWYLDGNEPKRRNTSHILKAVSTLAACFFLCLVSLTALTLHSDAAIYLDVNPSISLRINHFDRVVSAQASNEDGEIVLENMNLKNTDLDVALNAILGSMVKHGYLNETHGTVLVSVECANQQRAAELELQVSNNVEDDIDSMIQAGKVLSQQIRSDDDLEALAERYGMTQGKASLLRKLVANYPNLHYEELANMSMSELVTYLQQQIAADVTSSNTNKDNPDDFLDDLEDILDDIDDDDIDVPDNAVDDVDAPDDFNSDDDSDKPDDDSDESDDD